MDATALVDRSVPIFDISAGLSVDPLASRELDLCLKRSPSPRFSLPHSGLLLMGLCVYVPEYRPERGNLRTRVLQAKHDHPMAGHFGYYKALGLLRNDYVWPSIRSQQTLSPSSLRLAATFTGPGAPMALYQYELYRPLPASNGLTAILVVIDRLSKEGVFTPTPNTVTAPDVADAFASYVFSKEWHASPCVLRLRIGIYLSLLPTRLPSSHAPCTSHQVTTPQPTVRWDGSTAPRNSTFGSIATTSRTTGPRSFR